MSGLGRIQRAILTRVDEGDADFYALNDLANLIYHRPAGHKQQQQAVLSAAQSIVRRYPEKFTLTENKSSRLLWVLRRDLD
jgi:hypothetical protein